MNFDGTAELLQFVRLLTQIEVPYSVGGSVAAGVWGMPRQTNDIDIAVWLDEAGARRLTGALGGRFVHSEVAMERAISDTEEFPSFQVLDAKTGMQFDLFVVAPTQFSRECFVRTVELDVLGLRVRFASAEETVVQKLRWFVLGNRTSERQWRDLRGVLGVTDLDWDWVSRWAEFFDVAGDLADLRKETGR